jgi:hypothetical protein
VSLYRYGESLSAPVKMEPMYAPEAFPGRMLVVAQPERIDSLLAIKGLSLTDAAIAARVIPGPPQKHAMLFARAAADGTLWGGGLANAHVKLYRYAARWQPAADVPAARSDGWQQWELRAAGDRLQMSIDSAPAAEATANASAPAGSLGVRVFGTELLLDDIRVRRLVEPEPTARVRVP